MDLNSKSDTDELDPPGTELTVKPIFKSSSLESGIKPKHLGKLILLDVSTTTSSPTKSPSLRRSSSLYVEKPKQMCKSYFLSGIAAFSFGTANFIAEDLSSRLGIKSIWL